MKLQIEALEELAALDAELRELTDRFTKDQKVLSDKKAVAKSLEDRLTRGRQSLGEMEKARGDLVGELRQMSIQVERSREKLSRCRTEREANAAQREIEELRKLYRDREIEVEKLDGFLEQARADMVQVTAERDALLAELAAVEDETVGRLAQGEAVVAEKEAIRKGLVANVPPVLYRRYELIRGRRGTAITSTTDGTCSVCHMRLPPMLFQGLTRENKFEQCPSCNRILYYRPGVTGDSSESGAP